MREYYVLRNNSKVNSPKCMTMGSRRFVGGVDWQNCVQHRYDNCSNSSDIYSISSYYYLQMMGSSWSRATNILQSITMTIFSVAFDSVPYSPMLRTYCWGIQFAVDLGQMWRALNAWDKNKTKYSKKKLCSFCTIVWWSVG